MKEKAIGYIAIGSLLISLCLLGWLAYRWQKKAFRKQNLGIYQIETSETDVWATTDSEGVNLWRNEEYIGKILGASGMHSFQALSPGGDYFASWDKNRLIGIWSVSDQSQIVRLPGHDKDIIKAEFSRSQNYLITYEQNKQLYIWDWQKKEIKKKLPTEYGEFSISLTDVLVYQSDSCTITFFDLGDLSEIKKFPNACGKPTYIHGQGVLSMLLDDDEIKLYDAQSMELIKSFNLNLSSYLHRGIKYYEDFLITRTGPPYAGIKIWNWKDLQLLYEIEPDRIPLLIDMALNNKGQLLAASKQGWVLTMDLKNGEFLHPDEKGEIEKKILRILSLTLFICLLFGFAGIFDNPQNKFAYWSLVIFFSLISLGLFGLILWINEEAKKIDPSDSAHKCSWGFMLVSFLMIMTAYLSLMAIFFTSISLFFGFISFTNGNRHDKGLFSVSVGLIKAALLVIMLWQAFLI